MSLMGQAICGESLTLHARIVPMAAQMWPDRCSSSDGWTARRATIGGQQLHKGFVVWVDTPHDFILELPFEVDADVDHLYAAPGPPAGSGWVPLGSASHPVVPTAVLQGSAAAVPNFARDLGVCCRRCSSDTAEEGPSPSNFACVQVDDPSSAWGLYAVADGHGPQGHLIATLLMHEVPGLVAMSPSFCQRPGLSLHQAFIAASEMVTTCQFADPTDSGSALSVVLLREGFLHVAWLGDIQVVLGRLKTAGQQCPATASPLAKEVAVKTSSSHGARTQPAQLRAVQLTASGGAGILGYARKREPPPAAQGDGCGSPGDTGGTESDGQLPKTASRGEPEVRRLQLRSEDSFIILGSGALWRRLQPQEAVDIVGRHSQSMALDAAAALADVAVSRNPGFAQDAPEDAPEEFTILVLYLAGDRHVSYYDAARASHVPPHRRAAAAAAAAAACHQQGRRCWDPLNGAMALECRPAVGWCAEH